MFLIYDSFQWWPSSLHSSTPFHPLSPSSVESTVYSVSTFLHFSIQPPSHRHSSNYPTCHFYVCLIRVTSGSCTLLTRDTTKRFICVCAQSSCVHSLQDSRLDVDRQCGGSEFKERDPFRAKMVACWVSVRSITSIKYLSWSQGMSHRW